MNTYKLPEDSENVCKSMDFNKMLTKMSDETIQDLYDAITYIQFHRKRFTDFVLCSREEAEQPADTTRSVGYFTYGESGRKYGYFKHIRKLTDIEQEWLEEYKECCYYYGQPCQRWQEYGDADEDCECVLGRECGSLVLMELDEESSDEN